jgi:hypothetical protein
MHPTESVSVTGGDISGESHPYIHHIDGQPQHVTVSSTPRNEASERVWGGFLLVAAGFRGQCGAR